MLDRMRDKKYSRQRPADTNKAPTVGLALLHLAFLQDTLRLVMMVFL